MDTKHGGTTAQTNNDDLMTLDEARSLLGVRGEDQVLHLARTRGWTLHRSKHVTETGRRRISLLRSEVQAFLDAGDNPLRDRMSMTEAARALGHSGTAEVSRLVSFGKIPAVRDHGRVWLLDEDVQRWATSGRHTLHEEEWLTYDEARVLLGVRGNAQVMSLAAENGWKRRELPSRQVGFHRPELEAFLARGDVPLKDHYTIRQACTMIEGFTERNYISLERHARSGFLPAVQMGGHWYLLAEDVRALRGRIQSAREQRGKRDAKAVKTEKAA
ncbi:TPA: hypothetical protein QDB07_000837 [Burkholderia vietnamiensis]|uniref:hypothetical protein n=1 Tax=Burkholderia glumae TaxID=337 RepID=UPI00214FE55F|nr:hypothetical protein [Burkholderia glumae]HDR9033388.1 hypothetical protein [Burkholderia vietnamiensis]